MRDSAGLKAKEAGANPATPNNQLLGAAAAREHRDSAHRVSMGRVGKAAGGRRPSSVARSLLKVSSARRMSVTEVLAEQEVNLKKSPPRKKGPVIRSRELLNLIHIKWFFLKALTNVVGLLGIFIFKLCTLPPNNLPLKLRI